MTPTNPIPPHGLNVWVSRARGIQTLHDKDAQRQIRELISGDAHAHQTTISDDCLEEIVLRICENELQACFLMVKFQDEAPQYAGGAIELPSVISEWNGKNFVHYPAIYIEDTYVLPEFSLRFREETKTPQFPSGFGLGTRFVYERLKLSVEGNAADLSFGRIAKARVSECSVNNLPMLHILKKLGATTDATEGSILEWSISDSRASTTNRQDIVVEGLCLPSDNETPAFQSNLFVAEWRGNADQRMAASFTRAISTFTGKTVIRVQLTTNGILPTGKSLEDAVKALILVGQEEALSRGWIDGITPTAFPILRIHSLNEPAVATALQTLGAKPRVLGTCPMLPIITNFTDIPKGTLDFDIPATVPFVTAAASYRRTFAQIRS